MYKFSPVLMLVTLVSTTASLALPGTMGRAWAADAAGDKATLVARFNRCFDPVEELLKANPKASEATTPLLKSPARVHMFRSQGLFKLYKKQFKDFGKGREWSKEFEDRLGKLDYAVSTHAAAVKSGKVDAETVAKLATMVAEEHAETAKYLRKEEWLEAGKKETRVNKLRAIVNKADWWTYDVDRAYVLTRIADEAQGVQEQLVTGRYDLTQLQGDNGIHELRRELRWLSIYADAVNGLLVYNENDAACPSKFYAPMAKDPAYLNHKYTQLPKAENGVKPCKLSRCLFYGLSKMIDDLGKVKEDGEAVEAVDRARAAVAGKPFVEKVDPTLIQRAQVVADELKKEELLPNFAAELRQCAGGN